MGILLPTAAMCLKKMQGPKAINTCHVQSSFLRWSAVLKPNFNRVQKIVILLVCAALHSHFKLFRFTRVEENEVDFDMWQNYNESSFFGFESKSSPNLSNPSSTNFSLDSPKSNNAEFFEALCSTCPTEKECNKDIASDY